MSYSIIKKHSPLLYEICKKLDDENIRFSIIDSTNIIISDIILTCSDEKILINNRFRRIINVFFTRDIRFIIWLLRKIMHLDDNIEDVQLYALEKEYNRLESIKMILE